MILFSACLVVGLCREWSSTGRQLLSRALVISLRLRVLPDRVVALRIAGISLQATMGREGALLIWEVSC